jgi:predicted O-methyltransferase YrrM
MARQMDIQNTPEHQFQFTRSWFRNRNLPTFRELIYPEFHGRPIVYLEIGVFEGQSMSWMGQHVLTAPGSLGIGIDPWLMTTKLDSEFMERVMDRADHNTKIFPNVELIRGNSCEVLRKMCSEGYAGITKNSVDICMIDGDHNRLAVYDDAIHVYQLVKPGGWILFDDVENDKPKQDHVKHGLDMFTSEYNDRIKSLWKHGYMEAYQKL